MSGVARVRYRFRVPAAKSLGVALAWLSVAIMMAVSCPAARAQQTPGQGAAGVDIPVATRIDIRSFADLKRVLGLIMPSASLDAPTLPLQVTIAYDYGRVRTDDVSAHPAYARSHGPTAGVDMVLFGAYLAGLGFTYAHEESRQGDAFGTRVDTSRDRWGFGGYISRPINPLTLVGIAARIDRQTGKSIFNGAASTLERGTLYNIAPFARFRVPTGDLTFSVEGRVDFNHAHFRFPRSTTSKDSLSSIVLSTRFETAYQVNRRVRLNGNVTPVWTVSETAFPNTTRQDPLVVILGGGARVRLSGAVAAFGEASIRVADDRRIAHAFRIGIIVYLPALLARREGRMKK